MASHKYQFFGPTLFNVFINELKEDVKSLPIKFVDIAKIGRLVNNEEKRSLIRSNLGCLVN